MAISATSRYANAVVQTVETPMGTRQEMRVTFPKARRIAYTYYRVKAGDRIDTIANAFYGDATLWWMIAEANPEILDWLWDPVPVPGDQDDPQTPEIDFDSMIGQVIRVPNA